MQEKGMKINKNKTKVVIINDKQEDIQIHIERTKIEQVQRTSTQWMNDDRKMWKSMKELEMYYAMNNNFIN